MSKIKKQIAALDTRIGALIAQGRATAQSAETHFDYGRAAHAASPGAARGSAHAVSAALGVWPHSRSGTTGTAVWDDALPSGLTAHSALVTPSRPLSRPAPRHSQLALRRSDPRLHAPRLPSLTTTARQGKERRAKGEERIANRVPGTGLRTTDNGPQDEAEKHRTPNAERRTPNAEYEDVAGSGVERGAKGAW